MNSATITAEKQDEIQVQTPTKIMEKTSFEKVVLEGNIKDAKKLLKKKEQPFQNRNTYILNAIINYFGSSTKKGLYGMRFYDIVLEYMELGTLKRIIINNNFNEPWYPTRNFMAIQMAKGIAYLHDNLICHRDIKLDNFLVKKINSEWVIKLADMGLAKFLDNRPSDAGTDCYRAPETYTQAPITLASDIFSYSCCLDELVTGVLIDERYENDQDNYDYAPKVQSLITHGKNTNPAFRPIISVIINELDLNAKEFAANKDNLDIKKTNRKRKSNLENNLPKKKAKLVSSSSLRQQDEGIGDIQPRATNYVYYLQNEKSSDAQQASNDDFYQRDENAIWQHQSLYFVSPQITNANSTTITRSPHGLFHNLPSQVSPAIFYSKPQLIQTQGSALANQMQLFRPVFDKDRRELLEIPDEKKAKEING